MDPESRYYHNFDPDFNLDAAAEIISQTKVYKVTI